MCIFGEKGGFSAFLSLRQRKDNCLLSQDKTLMILSLLHGTRITKGSGSHSWSPPLPSHDGWPQCLCTCCSLCIKPFPHSLPA